MSSQLAVSEALDLVPGWNPENTEVEPLDGGFTNQGRVYHVRSKGDECVLRLDTDNDNAFGLSRSCEIKIQETAAQAGLAPAVVYANPDAGILMTEYLRGRVWQESDLESADNIESLAELLRRVHALPACCSPLDLTGIAEKYEEHLKARQGLHAFALNCVRIIRERPVHEGVTCCHNDIVAENVIESGSLNLIDWEYACDNDPMFDLASAIGFHDLAEKKQQMFLHAYAGGAAGELQERLADQVRVFDAIQWLWLATRHLASPRIEQARRLEELQQRIR